MKKKVKRKSKLRMSMPAGPPKQRNKEREVKETQTRNKQRRNKQSQDEAWLKQRVKEYMPLCVPIRIVAIADAYGIGVVHLTWENWSVILLRFKITKKDVQGRQLHEAIKAEQEIDASSRRRAWALGGLWNGKRSPETEAKLKEALRATNPNDNGNGTRTSNGNKASKDAWGQRAGTVAADINAAILKADKPLTVDAIVAITKAPRNRVSTHAKYLDERGLVVRRGEGKELTIEKTGANAPKKFKLVLKKKKLKFTMKRK